MTTLTDSKKNFNPDQFSHLKNPRIMRIRQVLAVYPIGRSTLYAMIKRGEFPLPVSLGARSVGWRAHDVFAFLASLEVK